SLSSGWLAQLSHETRASFFLNSVFPSDLPTDLALPSRSRALFASPNDLGPHREYFVVSHVGLNVKATEALFYVDHFCGGLCGGGEYVLMRKVNGVWHIAGRQGTWVS